MRISESEYLAWCQRQATAVTPKEKRAISEAFKLAGQQPTEDEEQIALASYLDLLSYKYGFRWFHSPNGGSRNIAEAAKFKRFGVKAGVPDVILLASPPLFPHIRGIAIELKRRHGGVVSEHQEQWLEYLNSVGFMTRVCKGWEAAKKFINEIGWE